MGPVKLGGALLLGSLAALAAGCGEPPLCDAVATANQTFESKVAGCPADGGITFQFNKFEKAKCETDVKSCSPEDATRIRNSLKCFDTLESCKPGTEFTFALSVAMCSPKVATACQTVMLGEPQND